MTMFDVCFFCTVLDVCLFNVFFSACPCCCCCNHTGYCLISFSVPMHKLPHSDGNKSQSHWIYKLETIKVTMWQMNDVECWKIALSLQVNDANDSNAFNIYAFQIPCQLTWYTMRMQNAVYNKYNSSQPRKRRPTQQQQQQQQWAC